MIPQKTIDTIQECCRGICENQKCGQPSAAPADARAVTGVHFKRPPFIRPANDVPPVDQPGPDALEPWEIKAGVRLGKDGERIIDYQGENHE